MKLENLTKLIHANKSFQKSVNIQLDLGNFDRINGYIPTASSIEILTRYLKCMNGESKEQASILIGPYGKGKSHLLLVLLALLGEEGPEIGSLREKILRNTENKELIEQTKHKRYLPVVLSPVQGMNLNDTFVAAIREALFREKLERLAPSSYYSQAIEVIGNWKEQYEAVYESFALNLKKDQGREIQEFIEQLEANNTNALAYFEQVYPQYTAGCSFQPMINVGAKKLYGELLQVLMEEHGYDGIFVVFDEFSKYVEGHVEEGFASDMGVLQEMCEMAGKLEGKLLLTLVVHKSIREYMKKIPQAAKDQFRGVEGRLSEIEFVVSGQNNYELIADAIEKQEPEFTEAFQQFLRKKEIHELFMESYLCPCFSKLFQVEAFERIICKGCFPMVPLFSYALLQISEKIAQNERTVFTFLADDSQGTLQWLLKKGIHNLIGVDKIYDYFKNYMKEAVEEQQIHREWVNSQSALKKARSKEEQRIIKALAVARIIRKPDEYPCQDRTLQLSLGVGKDTYQVALEALIANNVIKYRKSEASYEFSSDVGVDVDQMIDKKTHSIGKKFSKRQILSQVSHFTYEIPKQFNQKYAMTRFFEYVFMEAEDFFHIKKAEFLFEEHFSDGKILLLTDTEKVDQKEILEQLESLGDSRILVLYSEEQQDVNELLRRYEVIQYLKKDENFMDGNLALLQELEILEEDLVYEINQILDDCFLPAKGKVWLLRNGCEPVKLAKNANLGMMISEICDAYYCFSPRINHELLNITNVGAQYMKARNSVMKRLLEQRDCSDLLQGTNPESMVFRATFVHTQKDEGCHRVYSEVEKFLADCAGLRQSFGILYKKLYGKDYGVRKGIIPLFLAKKLSEMDTTAVLYIGDRELELSSEALSKVNDNPDSYEIYLEQKTAEKEKYLLELEAMFCVDREYLVSRQGRISNLVKCMQNWYRSLSQYAMVTQSMDAEILEAIRLLRNTLRRAEVNPHELLFDKYIKEMGDGSYQTTIAQIKQAKAFMDGTLQQLQGQIALETKRLLGARENESLKAVLHEWYESLGENVKSFILGTSASNFMGFVSRLQTNDEKEIVSSIAKLVTDIYVEDWTDQSIDFYIEELSLIKAQIKDISEQKNEGDEQGYQSIILRSANGEKVGKFLQQDTEDSTSQFLKNAIEETLEEFGDSLEKNQKVAVLVEMLGELLN